MKVTTDTVATREAELTIEPDQAALERALRRAARQISRLRPVAGFRPGRAPYHMVERLYGKDVLLEQAVKDIGQQLYREAVEEAGIEPFEPGTLDIESTDPVVLKARVPMAPKVSLADYSSLHIDPEPEVAVTEEQVNERLERLRMQHAEYVPVERPVQFGDQIVATVKGTVDSDQVIDEQDMAIGVADGLTPPGFGEALVGMQAGEAREFSLAYPEDFDSEELAGENVDFAVTVSAVREVILPELDDDLAKMAGDYGTLVELREALTEEIQAQLTTESRQREANAAVEALPSVALGGNS